MNSNLIRDSAQNLLKNKMNSGFTELTIHEYKNEIGEFVYAKARLINPTTGEKIIRPISRQNSKFVLKDPVLNSKKPLYNLDNLQASDIIYFVEGEKCADRLINLGLTATTSGSTTSHTNTDFKPLQNKTVILWADNDNTGKKHITEVSNILMDLSCKVSEIDIKILNLEKGEDVDDWLNKYPESNAQTINNLIKLDVGLSQITTRKNNQDKLNHLLIALEVINHFDKDSLIFVNNSFWHWNNSGIWQKLDDRELKKVINNKCKHEKITSSVVISILDLVKTETYVSQSPFDQDKTFINCLNGELRYLKSGWDLKVHDRRNFRTSIIPIEYKPASKAQRFEQFLGEVFNGDDDKNEKKLIVIEALGYTLIPDSFLEKFILLIGNGANGKSVLLSVVKELVGMKNVSAVQPQNYGDRFQRGHLHTKLANIVTELKVGGELAEEHLKSLVSGELTTGEHKGINPFEFIPIATHWFGANHMPKTKDFSDALFRRAIVLTFNNKFEDSNRDTTLTLKLKNELSGIFNLALDGLARLYNNQCFTQCQSNLIALDEWKFETDPVSQFVAECCEKIPAKNIANDNLFENFVKWSQESGITNTLGKAAFLKRLTGLGFKKIRTNSYRGIADISLKTNLLCEVSIDY